MNKTSIFSAIAMSGVLLTAFYISSWKGNVVNSLVEDDTEIVSEIEANPMTKGLPLTPPPMKPEPLKPEPLKPLERESVDISEEQMARVKLHEQQINDMMMKYDEIRSDSELRRTYRDSIERELTQYSEDIKPIILATIEQSRKKN